MTGGDLARAAATEWLRPRRLHVAANDKSGEG